MHIQQVRLYKNNNMNDQHEKSKKDLIEELAIALNSHLTDDNFFLDLTLQDRMPSHEDILYSGYRYNAFTALPSKEEIQEVRKKHRLVEIDSIPSYIG